MTTRTLPLLTGTQVVDGLIDAARKLGGLAFHDPMSRMAEPGFPDLIIVVGRDLFALEAKSKGEQLRPATVAPKTERLLPGQEDWLRGFAGIARVTTGVVRDRVERDGEWSYDEVLELLKGARG